jgi:hypothetical protein
MKRTYFIAEQFSFGISPHLIKHFVRAQKAPELELKSTSGLEFFLVLSSMQEPLVV